MPEKSFVIGVDFGTDSVRSVVVDTDGGREVASAVFAYPRWKEGLYCNPAQNQFRQHPLDYIEGLESTIKQCLHKAGAAVASAIKGISVDTTGSTPVAVDQGGTPLSLLPEFENNPNAMFVLWKDHTATGEAAQINARAAQSDVNYLRSVGGIYSSEWFWAKLLRVLRADEKVRQHCHSWVEHCDWIPFLLTDGKDVSQMKRGVCAAGHKALWDEHFGGLPPNEFFTSIDPLLDCYTSRLYHTTYTADQPAGNLSAEWAGRLGLPVTTVVGVGAFDAHMGAVGGQIEPYHLSKVMGTSTCDILIMPTAEAGDILVEGICGQVRGSVVPGMLGLEAGQSAFGDTYAWFRDILMWPLQHLLEHSNVIDEATSEKLIEEFRDKMIRELSEAAKKLPLEETSELYIDWLNGRRTPDANQLLKATISGLSLATDAPRIFKSLVEGTCFGAKAIIERFIEQGVPVRGLIGIGGVAKKSPYIMQTMADITGIPIRIHRSEQTCAAGAAMFAATAAGIYDSIQDAMDAMGQGFDKEYFPDQATETVYAKKYAEYRQSGKFIEQQLMI